MAVDEEVTKIGTAVASATVTILEDNTDCKFVTWLPLIYH